MAHVTSYKVGGAIGVLKHDERSEHDHVQERKNESIDNSRTHLNYNMATKRSGTLMQHIKRVCDENNVRLSNRKDLNVMCSWVVTAPKTVQPAELPLFFKTCFDFLEKKYGKQYTLSATVHMDETTPHLHYCFLPVGFDTKNNRLTVSSKLVLSRSHLRTFHKELESELKTVFGWKLGIENGATKDGNKEIQELKYQTAVKRAKEAEQLAEQAEIRLNDLQGRVLSQEEVNALKGKKTLTGALKGVSYEEYLSLVKTAQNVNIATRTVNKLKDELEQVKKERDTYKSKSASIDLKLEIQHNQAMSVLKNQLTQEQKLRKTERSLFTKIVNSLSPEAKKEFAQAEQRVRAAAHQRKQNRDKGMHL